MDKDGNLVPWQDDIWKMAMNAVNYKMSKKYIYIYISQNRNRVSSRLHKQLQDDNTDKRAKERREFGEHANKECEDQENRVDKTLLMEKQTGNWKALQRIELNTDKRAKERREFGEKMKHKEETKAENWNGINR